MTTPDIIVDPTIKKYRDLNLDFVPNPITGDISIWTGTTAVAKAVKNLVLTNFYERPFSPGKGSNVRRLLFENPTASTAQNLKTVIIQVIQNFEKRVQLQAVNVQTSDTQDGYSVTIVFFVVNLATPVEVSFFLQRLR